MIMARLLMTRKNNARMTIQVVLILVTLFGRWTVAGR